MKFILSGIILASFVLMGAQRIPGPGGTASSGGGGTPVHIQSCTSGTNSGVTSSVTATCGSAIGAGHQLWACIANVYYGLTPTWTGDTGTFTDDPNFQSYGFSSPTWYSSCYYVPSTGGGGTSITATGTMYEPCLTIDEFSGVGAFDKSDSGIEVHSTTPTGNAITPSANGSLLVGFLTIANANGDQYGITPTGSWSLGAVCGNANQGGPVLVYQTQTTAASIAVTASQSYALDTAIHIAAFAP